LSMVPWFLIAKRRQTNIHDMGSPKPMENMRGRILKQTQK
jgi:hypothetical protein